MEVADFAEIAEEFAERVNKAIWCSFATVDGRGRPRSRVIHPIWEGTTGWITSRPESHKSKHLLNNPYVSLAYVADVAKPVYVDCHAAWEQDADEKRRVWEYIKVVPPPMGFDPGTIFKGIDDPGFGLLRLTPWRIELSNFPRESRIWRPATQHRNKGEHMDSTPAAVRGWFEGSLRDYWQRRYDASLRDEDAPERYLDQYRVSRETYLDSRGELPKSVQEGYDYYLGTVEAQDWGSVCLYRVPVDDQLIYAVRVTTDGDDGWLELYAEDGTELGIGRSYLELIGWGEKATIRGQVENGQFPPELADASERTLWGKQDEKGADGK